MVSNDSKSFLYRLVKQASDADLFLSHFSLCSTEEALKGNFEMNGKPVVIYGTPKRLDLAKKKLNQIYKKREVVYREELMHFIENEEIVEFITGNLDKLTSGQDPELPINEKEDEIQTTDEHKEDVQKSEDEINQGVEETAVSSEETTPEDNSVVKGAEVVHDSHLCQYGVPKFKIEHISPDVMGLKESINVGIDEDYIKNYFRNVVPKLTKLI